MSRAKKKRKHKPSFIYSIVSIAMVLLVMGILATAFYEANSLTRSVRENINLHVELKDDAEQAAIFQLQGKLEKEAYVKQLQFTDKEQAAAQLKNELGEDFMELLGYNPLYASLNINVNANYCNSDSLSKIKSEVELIPIVKSVTYQEKLVASLDSWVQRAFMILGGLGLLLLIIAIALIDNTIRLAMFSDRFLIRSMQLVGATRWFIVKPFFAKGISNGILSGALAGLGLLSMLHFVKNQMPEISVLNDLVTFVALLSGIVILGMIISGLSTLLAVRKYLDMKLDDLY